ncbi:specific histone demethylase 1 homolog [Seminavis robusta]|uniref:Specific histone demethylase 1 homolog n=1 Tax=Seminavis robusta TaxID=568900 RepID=A0A9N8DGB4_9STRA|nr:specific histone demethylase 1 homolog [Seminavis robusta]|eukprot:Sro111_g055430.1 specific histone demethylase 1 homolog (789) ;mRNA; f:103192-105771
MPRLLFALLALLSNIGLAKAASLRGSDTKTVVKRSSCDAFSPGVPCSSKSISVDVGQEKVNRVPASFDPNATVKPPTEPPSTTPRPSQAELLHLPTTTIEGTLVQTESETLDPTTSSAPVGVTEQSALTFSPMVALQDENGSLTTIESTLAQTESATVQPTSGVSEPDTSVTLSPTIIPTEEGPELEMTSTIETETFQPTSSSSESEQTFIPTEDASGLELLGTVDGTLIQTESAAVQPTPSSSESAEQTIIPTDEGTRLEPTATVESTLVQTEGETLDDTSSSSVPETSTALESTVIPTEDSSALEGTINPSDLGFDVVVVGGGWSGLGALDSLINNEGVDDVILLEAHSALGGRSRTIYDFVPGVSTELGSAWVYQDRFLPNQFSIPLGSIDYNTWDYLGLYQNGSEIVADSERRQLLNVEWLGRFAAYSEIQEDLIEEGFIPDKPYSQILSEYFVRISDDRTRRFINSMVDSQIQMNYASPLGQVSVGSVGGSANRAIFRGAERLAGVPYSGSEGGGFGRLIRGVAEPHQGKIRLNSRVTKIEYDFSDGEYPVRVTYLEENDINRRETISAKKVLVTTSLGVLKEGTIEFVPSLPSWKQNAINQMGFGVINKCFLFWDESSTNVESWWPDRDVMILVPNEGKQGRPIGLWLTYFNLRNLAPGGDGPYILSSWAGGEAAEWSEANQSELEVVENILGNLRQMFGSSVPEPTRYFLRRWGQDDLYRGAYSFPTVGIDAGDVRDDLERSVDDRLFFAGEATTRSYGTTYGAYESGRGAAGSIANSLRI